MPESLFNKVAGLRSATLLKKRLWHRCFPVNFAKFQRTPFLQNASGRLLLCKYTTGYEVYIKLSRWRGYTFIYRNIHRRCSIKKLFLKISQYSQENTSVESLFNKAAGLHNLGQNICRLFHISAQFLFITSETTRLLSPESSVRVASQVAEQIKT